MTELPRDLDAPEALAVDDAWWPRAPRVGTAYRHTVGVRAVDLDTWLRPRPHDGVVLAWKAGLLDAAGDRAFLALPGTGPAGRAALDLVAASTPPDEPIVRDHATKLHDHGGGVGVVGERHPLDVAGRLVAEDLCLMDVGGDVPVLVAGSVAMPSRWRLADKLGRDLLGVHGPVPHYAEQIGTPTDRLLLRLGASGPDRAMARTAWTMTDDPALFQPADGSRIAVARPDVRSAADAAAHLVVRTEYQTVRALPGHDAVLFTIRTGREPLGALERRPDRAAALLEVISSMPPEQLDYKGVAPYLDHVTGWLLHCAGRTARGAAGRSGLP